MGRRLNLGLTAGAVIAGVVALSAASASAARSGQVLLRRYQPVTVLDKRELFAPTTVGSFVADANLETQTAPGVWSLVSSQPTPATLPTQPTAACVARALVPCFRLNQRDCTPKRGLAAEACFRTDWLSPTPRSVVYGRVTHTPRQTVLQYWYFYYDDLYSYHYPPDSFIWDQHEGDWEAVTVLILRGSPRPSWVGYSQHCTGERRAWQDVPRWRGTTHPVADEAIGSHANDFAPGDHPIAPKCLPAQALELLQEAGLAPPVDHSHPGPAYGPAGLAGVRSIEIRTVTATRPAWMAYIGIWGQSEYLHAPSPVGTRVSGTSPPSPPEHLLWQHPVTTVLAWPQTR